MCSGVTLPSEAVWRGCPSGWGLLAWGWGAGSRASRSPSPALGSPGSPRLVPQEKERQRLENLRRKEEAEQLRRQKVEEDKRRRLEEVKL